MNSSVWTWPGSGGKSHQKHTGLSVYSEDLRESLKTGLEVDKTRPAWGSHWASRETVYVSVCMCVFVREKERDGDRQRKTWDRFMGHQHSLQMLRLGFLMVSPTRHRGRYTLSRSMSKCILSHKIAFLMWTKLLPFIQFDSSWLSTTQHVLPCLKCFSDFSLIFTKIKIPIHHPQSPPCLALVQEYHGENLLRVNCYQVSQ